MASLGYIRKYFLCSIRIFIYAIILVMLILTTGIFFLYKDTGRNYVSKIVMKKIEKSIGYKIDVEGFSFAAPLEASINKLSLSDAEGTWIEAKNISISLLSPPSIHYPYFIKNVNVGMVNLLKIPDDMVEALPLQKSKPTGNIASTSDINFTTNEGIQTLILPNITLGTGKCKLEAIIKDKDISVVATGTNILLPELGFVIPQEFIRSLASFNLNISGKIKSPEAYMDLNIGGIKFRNNVPDSAIKVSTKIQKSIATINAVISNKTLLNSNINARLPVSFTVAPLNLSINKNLPMKGNVDIAVNISSLSKMLLPFSHLLNGDLKAKLALSGSVSSPLINGEISLANGSYSFLPLGLKLQKLSATITANNRLLTLASFNAEDTKAHKLNAEGSAEYLAAHNFIYNIAISGDQFNLLNHPNIRGQFSGDIYLKGNNTAASLGGSIKSNSININLPERLVASVPELNVVGIISAKGTYKKPYEINFSYPVELDVKLVADNKVFIRGWGVNAELLGKLAVTGNISKPEVQGKLSTIRGRYEEFGKQFNLKQADLLFEGDIPPSPYLTIVGIITESGVEIMPTISGPILDPELSIKSSPLMPQEEALSTLLFGKNSSKISPVQAAQLANSLRKLTGKGGGGFDPISKVRQLLGVDDITVNNNGNTTEDTSVGVGKYIGDNIYLEVEGGAHVGSDKANIKMEVTPNISVETSTGTTGDNSVGVQWKHDY